MNFIKKYLTVLRDIPILTHIYVYVYKYIYVRDACGRGVPHFFPTSARPRNFAPRFSRHLYQKSLRSGGIIIRILDARKRNKGAREKRIRARTQKLSYS